MSLNLEKRLAKERGEQIKKPHPKREEKEVVNFKTPLEEQAWRLQKLMENPDKPASIPQPKKEKAPRAPRDFNPNVMGSTAGAGSGEFHVYRHDRAKEYERLRWLEKQDAKARADKEFEEKKRQQEAEDNAKTAKKREKRKRLAARKAELKEAKRAKAEAEKVSAELKLTDGAAAAASADGGSAAASAKPSSS